MIFALFEQKSRQNTKAIQSFYHNVALTGLLMFFIPFFYYHNVAPTGLLMFQFLIAAIMSPLTGLLMVFVLFLLP